MKYDPEKHHRRSIRLKGHDYAGGGEYFITMCAHREFIRAAGGRPFHIPGARELMARVWESTVGAGVGAPLVGALFMKGTHEGCPYVIMPDHFHGLIDLPVGAALGDVMGAFKSRVVHEWIAAVKKGDLPEFPGKIWQRNYFEKIIRSREERVAIEKYIRLNPARLIWEGSHVGAGFMPAHNAPIQYSAFGNPNLLEMKKVGILASGAGAPVGAGLMPALRKGWAWISGFHSGQEQSVLSQTGSPAIRVAAVAPEKVGLTDNELRRLAEGRLLVICPFREEHTTRENALRRNRLVAEWCDKIWIPSARKGGSLEMLKEEYENKLFC